ncbi:MAG TPA: tRNA (N6-isopentenyl adenosine(37)-C2)-methylthiotransferase MiaB [Chitinophagales bacterium]|nr:tRNA (N6-isopentenyl adenosine(37)-C2)-methylthiotransferase MiaB [Chitinophagales bacterium]HNL84165.1 tRNA (N6-isopentenyl adenosine(37)-C2)-methylthiotransferase MiaB [Chitinophagales bacterium]
MSNELLDYIENKKHDEARQGEALDVSLQETELRNNKHFYIESYGCQMNFSDSEIVASILANQGYSLTTNIFDADLVLLNTCSIREKAEQTVRNRLNSINDLKSQKPGLLIGILGCMAERLKSKLLEEEHLVDLVVGPDAYRSLPELLAEAENGQKAVNVLLSREETYADISPVRLDKNGVTAFISIMRGCDNMCSFCVVPFTRGRERSRNPESIVKEARDLFEKGYREVTLLGQNVDSYKWKGESNNENKETEIITNFAQLLEKTASVHPDLRVRFSTSHPKDITDEVLETMAKHENICKYIHLPVQSGNTACLERMNRTYTREWYLDRVDAIKRIIPGCGLSSDMIAGFCGETEEEHEDTLSLMDYVKFDMSYMFFYSERPGTLAARKFKDDVDLETKKRRLNEIINLQNKHSIENNQQDVGKVFKVLIEKTSKKSEDEFSGRTSQNKMVVFPREHYKIGEYVNVLIEKATGATLIGKVVS